MGGFFGAVSTQDVSLDIFFGVDYHSHLGTRRGGMIIHDAKDGFQRQIHSIENTPFRTKFEKDLTKFHGTSVCVWLKGELIWGLKPACSDFQGFCSATAA